MNQAFQFERALSTGKDEWLTPPELIRSLGDFDLDPCTPIHPPWLTAANRFHKLDNGLLKTWHGRVWLNPPYGSETGKWLGKLAAHGNGIALIFARTETESFFKFIWEMADAVLFIRGRLKFYHVTDKKLHDSPSPSVLVAYGKGNVDALKSCNLPGKFISLT